MKMNKKNILLVSLLVCAVAILSLGTLAWFNATADVTNTFKVSTSDAVDGTPDFSVEVWENENDGDDALDADGDGNTETTTTGNTYEHIAPGDVIAKNPTVENTGDYDQYIRVYVTFSDYAEIEQAYTDHSETLDLRTWLNVDSTVWEADDTLTSTDTAADTITYGYYLNDALDVDATAELFSTVTIPYWFVQEDMSYGTDGFSVNVLAQAIQAANTGADAQTAFTNWLPEYDA
ncbi:MAG: hypothetical protein E7588_05860 [Ruminococcaceae bacterium]|nr:hypothetical protein [Oscillospiraceae bacterium]